MIEGRFEAQRVETHFYDEGLRFMLSYESEASLARVNPILISDLTLVLLTYCKSYSKL